MSMLDQNKELIEKWEEDENPFSVEKSKREKDTSVLFEVKIDENGKLTILKNNKPINGLVAEYNKDNKR